MSWMFDLRNRTKNEDLKDALSDIRCTIKDKAISHKPNDIYNNDINVKVEYENEYNDDEGYEDPDSVKLLSLRVNDLPCPEELSDPTELPLSRESIGMDMSFVKYTSSATRQLSNVLSILSLISISFLSVIC